MSLPQCAKTKLTAKDNPLECANIIRVIQALTLYESWRTNKQSNNDWNNNIINATPSLMAFHSDPLQIIPSQNDQFPSPSSSLSNISSVASPLHSILSTQIPNYDLSQLLNDYQHALRIHCNDTNQMESIHQNIIKQFGRECDLNTCKKLERNNRQKVDNTNINILNDIYTNSNNVRDIALQQQLDVIHSYFVHCFQLTRFTSIEEQQIEQYNTENDIINENEEGNEGGYDCMCFSMHLQFFVFH